MQLLRFYKETNFKDATCCAVHWDFFCLVGLTLILNLIYLVVTHAGLFSYHVIHHWKAFPLQFKINTNNAV